MSESITMTDPLEAFGRLFTQYELADEVASAFSCYEADVIATLLASLGRLDEAEWWLTCHSRDDDCGDPHWPHEGGDHPKFVAADYVQALTSERTA